MAGPECLKDVAVIFGSLIGVANEQGDGRARGEPLVNTGQDFDLIWFVTLGYKLGGTRATVRLTI